MKTTQSKKFEPIVITIETEDEAKLMFSMVNCGWGKTLKEYLECHYGIESRELDNVRTRMFDSFSEVFKD